MVGYVDYLFFNTKKGIREMTYISRCEHGTPMALCRKCFPDVSEQPDWSKYRHTHPVKELTDEEIMEIYNEILIHDKKSSIKFARAILKKAQEK